jgi:hypothetical protein
VNKRAVNLIFLLLVSTFSMNLFGVELKQDYHSTMQLAWVRLPNTSTVEKVSDIPTPETTPETKPEPKLKPKPKPKARPPEIKPAQAPVTKPVNPPVTKPIQLPAFKPARAPVDKPVKVPVEILAQPALAKPAQPSVSKETQAFDWVVGLGADFGGEELGRLYYTDGSSASVKANNGIALYIGAIIPNRKDSPFSTHLTLGYKFGGPRGTNGDITWSAIPLEGIEFYHTHSMRLGLGLSYHFRPQLSVNLPSSSYTSKYDNAIGLIAQIGWAPVGGHFNVDLRYTSIKFQQSDVPGAPTVDGSVAGIYTNFRF